MDAPDDTDKAVSPSRLGGRMGRVAQWSFLIVIAAVLLSYGSLPPGPQQAMAEITRVFLGIVLEALPFMLIGALVGGLIEEFVPQERIARLLPEGSVKAVLLAAGLGIVLPTCECAIVPIIRRLLRKGTPLSAAVAYMLAGPIVNPIVAAATVAAYRPSWTLAATRLLMGYGIAVGVGLAMGRLFKNRSALLAEHAHSQPHGGQSCCGHGKHKEPSRNRLASALGHASEDFLSVGVFLVVGAFIAAVMRGAVSQDRLMGLSGNPFASILAMMALAFLLNLCSEADAFVAASFRGVVPVPAQLAFLVLGPMLDAKLLMMYLGLFRKRAVVALVLSIVVLVFVATVAYQFLAQGLRP